MRHHAYEQVMWHCSIPSCRGKAGLSELDWIYDLVPPCTEHQGGRGTASEQHRFCPGITRFPAGRLRSVRLVTQPGSVELWPGSPYLLLNVTFCTNSFQELGLALLLLIDSSVCFSVTGSVWTFCNALIFSPLKPGQVEVAPPPWTSCDNLV